MWKQPTGLALLTALVLGCVAGRADDAHRSQDPDAGFLEFLGSVDRLAEVNPNYLSPGDPAKAGAKPARPAAPDGAAPASTPQPAPRQALPPSASNGSGGPTNE
jgi:hypothetical protein